MAPKPYQSTQRLFNARAAEYDNSWHPDYIQRLMSLAPLKPGDRVLDLCCGTGLGAFFAADVVGDYGEVVGVDISAGMLKQLSARQEREVLLGKRIRAFHHDVTRLNDISVLQKKGFDLIICSCGLSLLNEPRKALVHWKEYLKPGGHIVVDIAHEQSARSGYILEQIAEKMGVDFPWKRCWVKGEWSLREMIESQGMKVERVVLLDRIRDKGSVYYTAEDADAQYDFIINTDLTTNAPEEFKENARHSFKEHWLEAAQNGRMEEVDALYVYIAREPLGHTR